MTVGKMI